MSVKHLIKARRPNGGTKRPITDHTDVSGATHEDTDGSPYDSPALRPDEYIISVDEQDANGVSNATRELSAVVLPEPWRPEDLSANGGSIPQSELLNRTPWTNNGITDQDGLGIVPSFYLDYANHSAVIPTALQSNHVRPSVATRWDANGDLVEDSADTPRLQRDPATGAALGLLYEPKRTQILTDPTDFSGAGWNTSDRVNITANAGTAKGQPYDQITEDTTNGTHSLGELFGGQSPVNSTALSWIVKDDGVGWVAMRVRIFATDLSGSDPETYFFDLQNGVTGSGNNPPFNSTLVEHSIEDLGGGWYRCKVVIEPDPGYSISRLKLFLADGDGVTSYTGDGTSGVLSMHAQAEVSREVTTPILTGGAVREADEVDYRFDFPDMTTGVAYSIEQQSGDGGGAGINFSTDQIVFGTTSESADQDHGVLMYNGGIEWEFSDGWKTRTRNTNEDGVGGQTPLDETIDRFQVKTRGFSKSETNIIRQIAIWTQTLTSQQKTDLESNYLTTP